MLATANQNKPLHFFRRFVEGWFSVYLSIFIVTLAVRLLFFAPEYSHGQATALTRSGLKTYHVLRHGFRHVHFSTTTPARAENTLALDPQTD